MHDNKIIHKGMIFSSSTTRDIGTGTAEERGDTAPDEARISQQKAVYRKEARTVAGRRALSGLGMTLVPSAFCHTLHVHLRHRCTLCVEGVQTHGTTNNVQGPDPSQTRSTCPLDTNQILA